MNYNEDELEKEIVPNNKSKKLLFAFIVVVVLCVGSFAGYKTYENYIMHTKYESAIDFVNNKQYEEAIEIFEEMTDYLDVEDLLKETIYEYENYIMNTKYESAIDLVNDNQYEEAIEIFETITDYLNVEDLLKEAIYKYGNQLSDYMLYEEAIEQYEKIADYSDAEALIIESYYLKGKNEIYSYDYLTAIETFQEIADYEDSMMFIELCNNEIPFINTVSSYEELPEAIKADTDITTNVYDKTMAKEFMETSLVNVWYDEQGNKFEISNTINNREYNLIAVVDRTYEWYDDEIQESGTSEMYVALFEYRDEPGKYYYAYSGNAMLNAAHIKVWTYAELAIGEINTLDITVYRDITKVEYDNIVSEYNEVLRQDALAREYAQKYPSERYYVFFDAIGRYTLSGDKYVLQQSWTWVDNYGRVPVSGGSWLMPKELDKDNTFKVADEYCIYGSYPFQYSNGYFS